MDSVGLRKYVGVVVAALVLVAASFEPASARKTLPSLQWELDGFYWARFSYDRNLALYRGQVLPGAQGGLREPLTSTQYFSHQIRLEPSVRLGKIASFHMRFDGLYDVVWGDNDGNAAWPLFSDSPSDTSVTGNRQASVRLRQAYMDFDVFLGRVRVGRMPVHWGLGLVSNGGGNLRRSRAGVDDDFGDNHFPTISDRAMFVTDIIGTARRLWEPNLPKNHSLYFAYSYGRVVEEPFVPGVPVDEQRPYGDSTFLSREANDVDEHAGILLYVWKGFLDRWFSRWGPTHLKLGTYFAYRRQRRVNGIVRLWDGSMGGFVAHDCASENLAVCGSDADLVLLDPYLDVKVGRAFRLRAEFYLLQGQIEPRTLSVSNVTDKYSTYGWVVRADSFPWRWLGLRLEAGQAAGDSDYRDATFRYRPMHPDHNVGLVLYDQFLRQRTAASLAGAFPGPVLVGQSPGVRAFQSNGGVVDSYYFAPTLVLKPFDFAVIRMAVLSAWSHRQDDILFQKGRGRRIGTEVDMGMDLAWGLGDDDMRHLLLRLEGGFLFFGPQVRPDYDAAGAFTVQARIAFVL